MKRFLLLLITSVLLFSSCSMISTKHYLILTADTNIVEKEHNDIYHIVFLNKNNKVLSESEKLAYNTSINISWSLIPITTKVPSIDELTITQNYDDYIFMKKQKDVNCLEYRPLEAGDTKITITSKKYGTASINIRVKIID